MLCIVSPAKKLHPNPLQIASKDGDNIPHFHDEALKLSKIMAKKTPQDLQNLMGISEKLATLNYNRYQNMVANNAPHAPAVTSFAGDVYQALNVSDFTDKDFDYAQTHLAILSGLYGLLRPLDSMAPYRLEMGINLNRGGVDNLTNFWRAKITGYIQKLLANHKVKILLNLASDEYGNAIGKIEDKTIHTVKIRFRQRRGNQLKNIGLLAKRARGNLAREIIKNRIDDLDSVKKISFDHYQFDESLSDSNAYFFIQAET